MRRILTIYALLAGLGLVVLGIVVGLVIHLQHQGTHQSRQASILSAEGRAGAPKVIRPVPRLQARRALLNAPSCPEDTGPLPASIPITLQPTPPYFGQTCYYTSAGQAFTITLANPVFDTEDKQPTQATLIISPISNPALVPAPQSGMAYGSTENAVFAAPTVTAPNTGNFTVPALPAGTYVMQILEEGLDSTVTLVAQ